MRIHKNKLIFDMLIELSFLNVSLAGIASSHSYFHFQLHSFLLYSLFLNFFCFVIASERYFRNVDVFRIRQNPLDYSGLRSLKRIFDIFFSSALILLIFSWLFPIIALIIKLTSKGPVFFIQERTGFRNRTFRCYKFRSMIVNDLSDVLQALPNDMRITPFGRFIRRTHIDELPQFLNVLMGQMSVVGPRPHMLLHTSKYSALINNYLMRHNVKPGITGWAQMNGYCGDTSEVWKMAKRVEYDLFYIRNWTFLLDIKIIWQTLFKDKSSDMLVETTNKNTVSVAAS